MAQPDLLQLQQPHTLGGVHDVNFFNGRLLDQRTLAGEQAARRLAEQRLGLALGDGVARGLLARRDSERDTPAAPVLRVAAGLAVNRAGQTLCLGADTSVALTRKFSGPASGGVTGTGCDCVFAACNPVADGVYVAGAGVYLLTIAPAQATSGSAPSNGLDPGAVRCNTDATVQALQFRLLALNPLRYADLDIASPLFRNRLAYRCFGIEAREAAAADPWRSDPPRYGLVDELRAVDPQNLGAISDADVPLALVYWTAAGLRFVDNWAVRRRLDRPETSSGTAFVARDRRLLEGHAFAEQFRAHLADLLATQANPAGVQARDHFRYLPPFGLLPLQGPVQRGFIDAIFFAGIPRPPGSHPTAGTPFIDARLLGPLQDLALAGSPTDLASGEFVWVWRPWQNTRAADANASVPRVLAFASGLLPDMASARFDLSRWDFSNHAACCIAT